MSVVAVASLPPPIAGQSVVTTLLVEALEGAGIEHRVVDLSREFAVGNRWLAGARRLAEVAALPARAMAAARGLPAPVVFYLQLGHSVRAMVRDVPLLAAARLRGWPAVVHVHGGGFREVFESAPALVRRALGRELASVAAAVVLSPGLRRMFEDLVPAGRIAVVANGTPRDVYDHARRIERAAPHHPLRVLYLSNLIDDKGYGLVLEAARRAPHRFTLAGAPTEWGSIDPRSSPATYLGPVSGAAKLELLESSDVLVLPTRMVEGQPIAILEAMQMGLPVVSCARGGIPDVVRDPDNGALIEPGDVDALLAALDRLGDPQRWAEVSRRNRAEALERYSPDRHGDALLEVLKRASGR